MPSLSSTDYKEILDIIEIVYEVPDTGAMFAAVCRKLQRLIRICGAVFIPVESKSNLCFHGHELFHGLEKDMSAYISHYAPLDPLAGLWSRNSSGCASITEFMPENKLLNSEYGYDFLLSMARIFFVLGIVMRTQGDTVGVFGLHRQLRQSDFNDRDKEVVNIVTPHMARSISNRRLIHGLDLSKDQKGIVALSGDGNPLYVNAEARRIL